MSGAGAADAAAGLIDETWQILSATPVIARHLGSTLERMPDIGLDAITRRSHAGADIVARIDAVDVGALDADLATTLAVARTIAAGWAKEAEWYWLAFDPLGEGFFSMFAPSAYSGGFVLNVAHEALGAEVIAGPDDVDRVVTIIADYARLVRQITERTGGQAEHGIYMPALQLANAVPLMVGLRDAGLAALGGIVERSNEKVDAAARDRIHSVISAEVEAAYDELLALLRSDDYAEHAPDAVGLSSYPGGAEIYDELVKLHTTLDLSPQQVHDRGHERMARIESEMRDLLASVGFAGTPAVYLRALADNPAWRASTDDEIAAHFQRYIDRFDAVADQYFGVMPRAGHGVAALPLAATGSMTFGYYSPPQPDRDTGVYFFNGVNLAETALPMIAALNYHELVPGHHLHLALQHEREWTHPLRQYAAATAYTEGWAEYAARFAGEIGMYEQPEERFGRLMMEAFLTSRLVVDTGMNAFGWTLERARDYMREHSFMGATEIDTETLRYSCDIPGQALAYKLGDDFLFELREEMHAVRGDAFEVATFHDAVLDAAGLPLPLVAERVRAAFGV